MGFLVVDSGMPTYRVKCLIVKSISIFGIFRTEGESNQQYIHPTLSLRVSGCCYTYSENFVETTEASLLPIDNVG